MLHHAYVHIHMCAVSFIHIHLITTLPSSLNAQTTTCTHNTSYSNTHPSHHPHYPLYQTQTPTTHAHSHTHVHTVHNTTPHTPMPHPVMIGNPWIAPAEHSVTYAEWAVNIGMFSNRDRCVCMCVVWCSVVYVCACV
jgi:hypothetical protein